ncbi:tailspike protein [Kosakonia phage Kc283]|uniref:Tailspike protein n=1 Tax=Kosakonia phage Kc283 TaxID=2863195 RepID=A0AAE8BIH3_9CAUD|nr:tailspike protein [Kosakonia phage Kc283]QYN79854.1 tailspike protein [Kosakonia phage Kc283]
MQYYAGIPNSDGLWTKTSEVLGTNKHPTDLNKLAFSDAAGNVFSFVYDPIRGVNLEQLGGKPYNSADLAGCDTAMLWLALLNYKRTIPTNLLIINLPSREYYSSKGIPVYQWITVRSTGKLAVQYRIGKGLWTDTQIPYVAMSGVNTFYSIKSFHFAIVHPTNVHASNVTVEGIDFVTNAGDSTDYGLYLPYFNEVKISNVRNTGIDIALYYYNGYSSVVFRHLATARTNTATKAGSWSIFTSERTAGVGCGTSIKFIECGYTDFILGISMTGMTYTHIDTCYTEGTLSEVVANFVNCTALTVTSYGIERLTSQRTAALVAIQGGSVVINGLIAAYNVNANSNVFLQISGGAKVSVLGLNTLYLTNGSTTGLVTTADNVEAFIGPMVYPATGTYKNTLGSNTFMLGTGGNITPRIQNAAAANFTVATDAVNTVNKYIGKGVYDRTLGTVIYASGPAATDVWRDGVGTIKYTPA